MKILIVDDEPDVVKVVRMSLQVQEPTWEALAAYDGEEALAVFEKQQPDLVLLDIMMPDMSGFDVLKELRLFSDVPVIMLTAKGDEIDRVMGLNLGADDYITKPFGHLELLARVKAVLRRAQGLPLSHELPFSSGDIHLDFERRQVTVKAQPVALTGTEYRLLYHLVRNAGQVLTHETLLARVWGREYTDEIDYLKVYISRLRNKIEEDPRNPQYILTEYGVGYWFRKA
ncbi:MAG: response regulator [Anaerolineae bacterium]|nr:response regulator [Anaerolineae bacterium]NIN94397.1 response regulator [Anaerolineae bacterium]NIQ77463.1 response regulator [Anaerolineae bacterium]